MHCIARLDVTVGLCMLARCPKTLDIALANALIDLLSRPALTEACMQMYSQVEWSVLVCLHMACEVSKDLGYRTL